MSQKREKRALRTKNTVAGKKKKDKIKENFLEHKAKKA